MSKQFIDLSGSIESTPEHTIATVTDVTPKRVNGHPTAFLWTLRILSEVKGAGLPVLPAPFRAQRAAVLEAMEGGVQFQQALKKFSRKGVISLALLRDGEPVEDGAPPLESPCSVHLVQLTASEGVARLAWKVTVTAGSEHAQAWVELISRDVYLAFKLGEGNQQLALFDDNDEGTLELVDDEEEAA